ncbi:MAG: hypothetical protein SVM80_03615 [Halobacteriota archaeon]|nr:hypothetical protein [Halobacteriota archaeon]
MINLEYGEGRCKLYLHAFRMGEDYVVDILGEGAHVGAIGVGCYDTVDSRASSSVITMTGHRDDRIAKDGAERISKNTKKTTVLIVGIHLDDITEEEISTIMENSKHIIDIFLEKMGELK